MSGAAVVLLPAFNLFISQSRHVPLNRPAAPAMSGMMKIGEIRSLPRRVGGL